LFFGPKDSWNRASSKLIIQPSDKRPASYEGNSKTDTFSSEKPMTSMAKGSRRPLRDSRREIANMNAENSVVCASVGNRVEVRTDEQSAIRDIRAGIQPVEISRGVNGHGHSQGRIQSSICRGRRASA